MRVLAIYNIKGGVGKTASAVNLAWLSARAGARTLLWDLDPQGASTFYFRVKPKVRGGIKKLLRRKRPIDRHIRGTDYDNLDLLPADFSFRHADLALDAGGKPTSRIAKLLRPLRKSYDHIYLDCSPGITLIAESVFAAADTLLVPTIPTTLALRTLEQLTDHLAEQGPEKLGVLPFYTMVDRRKALHTEIVARAAGSTPVPFLAASIPYSSRVEQMGLHRAPLGAFDPGCPAARAYGELWDETMAHVGSWLANLNGTG